MCAQSCEVIPIHPELTTPNRDPGTVPRFVARARLFVERFVAEADKAEAELCLPVLSLCFDYSGTVLRAGDDRPRFFVSQDQGLRAIERDRVGESRLQRLIESFGAVELQHVPHLLPPLDSEADYLVHLDGNPHVYCSFSAHAVVQLRRLGCEVSIADDYPYQVVDPQTPLHASVLPDELRPDWFSLQLGIDVDGGRVDLLPALVAMLDGHSGARSLEELLRVPARAFAIPVGGHRHVLLPPERLRALLQVVLELYRGDQVAGAIRFPAVQARSAARLEDLLARGWSTARIPGVFPPAGQTRRSQGLPQLSSASLPDGLKGTLRPYQRQGVAWLSSLRQMGTGGILADDMGLGKTLQIIAHLLIESKKGLRRGPMLVVVPTSLSGNWQRELSRFAPGLRCVAYLGSRRHRSTGELRQAPVIVTTYAVLVRDIEQLCRIDYHLVVLDEAQAIKNPRSLTARCAKRLRAAQRMCLTGTPVENNLGELWSLLDFSAPDLLGSFDSFRERFRQPIERAGCATHLAALRARIEPFVLRRMKEQVLDELPPKTEIVHPVELDCLQRDLYESIRAGAHAEVRRAISARGIGPSTVTILDALMKLRQVCCDPQLVRMPAASKVTASAKRQAFFELLEAQLSQGRRVLVFSQFVRMLVLLSEGLRERNIRHMILTGSTVDRQRRVDAFQSGQAEVFLVSLKAGGTGLNLTRADTVIHYDPWWNAAAQAQATDRAHRLGQTRPVFVYNLIVAGSVEEKILALQTRKRELSAALLQGSQGTGQLQLGDIERLFAPLDG